MSQATSTSGSVQETLSAAMDGEATPDELHGALDAASGDDELRAKWDRMHFASAVMRGALTRIGNTLGFERRAERNVGVALPNRAAGRDCGWGLRWQPWSPCWPP